MSPEPDDAESERFVNGLEKIVRDYFARNQRLLSGFVIVVDQIHEDGGREAEIFAHSGARSWDVAGLMRFAVVNADEQLRIPMVD